MNGMHRTTGSGTASRSACRKASVSMLSEPEAAPLRAKMRLAAISPLGMLRIVLAFGLLCTTGCITSGIVKKPDLKKLSYDKEGILKYDGKEVDGIKLKLPWHQEMWPDNASEWSFSLLTFGAGVGIGSASSGSSGSGEDTDAVVTAGPVSGGGGSSGSSGSSGGGGSGGGGSGGDESPF